MQKLKVSQARTMLRLQSEMNATVDSRWLQMGFPFLRAVVVEAGEALDHVGWKWWKKQVMDIEQVRVELIDILHFYLSAALVLQEGNEEIAANFLVKTSCSSDIIKFDGNEYHLKKRDLLELLELIAGLATARRLEISVLEACFEACDLSWDEASKIYVSKNVLNIFRQRHGYKEGSYVKIWEGEEDNVYLMRQANSLDINSASYSTDLYAALEEKYKSI